MNSAQDIVFGQNLNQIDHAFRYTDALGLERANVMDAIRGDLQPHLPLQTPPPDNAPTVGSVTVNGIELGYHAYPVNKGLVNVGSITPP